MAIYNITTENTTKEPQNDDSYGGVQEPLDEAFNVDKEESFEFDYLSVSNFYDRVRGALNVPASSLDNSVIDFPENAPLAEMEVKARIKEYEAMTEGQRILYGSAIVYMTCFNLVDVALSKQVKKQSTSNLTVEYSVNDSDNPKMRFSALANDLIDKINGVESYGFVGFAVTPSNACPCRKRR